MSKKEEIVVKHLSNIADVDASIFKALSDDLMDLYEKGTIRVALAGPRLSVEIPDTHKKVLKEKLGIDDKKFDHAGKSFFYSVHYVLAEEADDMIKILKEKKDVETAEKFRRKIELVKETLDTHPSLKKTYLTYTFSKLNIFEDVQWEADLKVFQPPTAHVERPYPIFPAAKLRFVLKTPELRPEESKTLSFEFEIAPKDLDILIDSLKDLREAL